MISILAALGIMSAMTDEAHLILEKMEGKETIQIGCKEFVTGVFEEEPIVFTLSGIGKVSAATTATLLISRFDVESIVFTGVAGGGAGTEIGDVVIGHTYLQHDVDIRPIFPQFYIFSLDRQALNADDDLFGLMKTAADRFFESGISFPHLGIHSPKVHPGVIASGDQFVYNPIHHETIAENVRRVLPGGFQAIEMEGAAVAQVCHELHVPFVVMRAISDKADHSAKVDFFNFTQEVASLYSYGILKEFIRQWKGTKNGSSDK